MSGRQPRGSSTTAFILGGIFGYAAWSLPVEPMQWLFGSASALTIMIGCQRLAHERDQERRRIAAETPSGVHGNAAFMTLPEAGRAGLLDPHGLFLGALDGNMLFHSGKAHLLTVAPARQGKGIATVIPNLLHWQGSAFVTDPKGELAAVSARHRAETFGQTVRVLNPWGLHGLPQDRFNPLLHLVAIYESEQERRGLTEEVVALALQLIPEPEDARNRFFREGSRKLLRALLLHMATRGQPDRCTLPELWRTLQNSARLEAALIDMEKSDALGGVVADLADDISRSAERSPEPFQNFCEGASQAIAIFDPASWLADSVSGSDFSFADLKRGKITVYLVIPADRIATHGAWLGLVSRQAIDAVARTPGNRQVLFMLDEFANMGKLAGLSESLTLLPGLGVRVWMIVQSLDQLRAVYGKEATSTVLSQAEVQQYFAVQDFGLSKTLSDALGQRTVKTTSINLGRKEEDDAGESRSEVGRPLMSADEIRLLPKMRQLLFIQGQPPVLADRVAFWDVSPWQNWAGGNPVEGSSPQPDPTYVLDYGRP